MHGQYKCIVYGYFINILGDVSLKNLRIKENALQELDLPVKVVSGYLSKLLFVILSLSSEIDSCQ